MCFSPAIDYSQRGGEQTHLGVGPNHHIRRDAVHAVWVSCFPNPHNHSVFHTDIGLLSVELQVAHLEDPAPVNDEGVCDDQIEHFCVAST